MTDRSMTTLRPYAHVLAVPDLERSVRYFRGVLGFHEEWADENNWSCLAHGAVRVMLGHCPDALPPAETGDHSYFGYFHTDDLDGAYGEIAPRGAIIPQPPTDKPWGMREMTVHTPDGHRMTFGQVLTPTPTSSEEPTQAT